MTYMLFHLKDLYEMVTGSPWPARVGLIILAVFSAIVLFLWLVERRNKKSN